MVKDPIHQHVLTGHDNVHHYPPTPPDDSKQPEWFSTQPESLCAGTVCPMCGANVFFVRHNNGCAWFDALGWPWPKHACFDVQEPSWLSYFRKYVPSREAQAANQVSQHLRLGVIFKVAPKDSDSVLLAFIFGNNEKICLALSYAGNVRPLAGFNGVLDLAEGTLTLSTYAKYKLLLCDVEPEELGLPNDWPTRRVVEK